MKRTVKIHNHNENFKCFASGFLPRSFRGRFALGGNIDNLKQTDNVQGSIIASIMAEVLQINTITVNDIVIPYSRYKDYIYVNGYGSNSTLIMDYIYRVDEAYFPPHFVLALEYELASIFAGSVARDSAMIRQFKELAERQFLVAKNIDAQETTTKVLDSNRFINLRRSTRTDV